MESLLTYLRSLRAKPRGFHVGLVLVLAWVPLLIYWFGHPVIATIALLVLAAAFLTIHPVTFIADNPPDGAAHPPAANDE